MQLLYFYFDDSGVLHKNNEIGKFVYAGYAFVSRLNMEQARREYRSLSERIGNELGRTGEIKAYRLENKYRRALYNVMRKWDSLAATINIDKLYNAILNNKKSICRYKDFVIKRLVKKQIKLWLNDNRINAEEDTRIFVFMDEQLTATDGIYSLSETIFEELRNGIRNFDYGTFYPPLLKGKLDVQVRYVDSSRDYLVQASDILANRIYTSYRDNRSSFRKFSNHICLILP